MRTHYAAQYALVPARGPVAGRARVRDRRPRHGAARPRLRGSTGTSWCRRRPRTTGLPAPASLMIARSSRCSCRWWRRGGCFGPCACARPADSRLITAAVASCLGIGLSSVTTFLAVSLGMFPGRVFVAADAVLWLAVGRPGLALGRHQVSGAVPEPARTRPAPTADRTGWCAPPSWSWWSRRSRCPSSSTWRSPHGQWDAWAIWNQKARFLFRAGDELDRVAWPSLVAARAPARSCR